MLRIYCISRNSYKFVDNIYSYFSSLKTAVHELGHTLGMSHDFNKIGTGSKGGGPQTCRSTPTVDCCHGFMHYGVHKNIWSDCSVRDFQNSYRQKNWGDGCFDGS